MSIIIDIVILAFIVIFLLVGIKRGFLLMLLPLLSIILSIVLGFALKGTVRSLLDKTSLEEKISVSMTNLFRDSLDDDPGEEVKGGSEAEQSGSLEVTEVTAEQGDAAVKESGVPDYIADIVRNWADKNSDSVYGEGNDTASVLGAKVASFAMDLIAFLIIAVIVIIVLLIIKLILKRTRELRIPVFHQLGSIGGAIVGVALAVVILYCITLVIGLLASCGILTNFADAFRKSILGGFLYDHNLIGKLVALVKSKF